MATHVCPSLGKFDVSLAVQCVSFFFRKEMSGVEPSTLKLREECTCSMIEPTSIIPSPKVSNTVGPPCIVVLSFNRFVDECMLFDSEALLNICLQTLKMITLTDEDAKHVVYAAVIVA